MKWSLLFLLIVLLNNYVKSQDTIPANPISIEEGTKKNYDKKGRTNKTPGNRSVSKIYFKLYGGYGVFTPGSYRFNSIYYQHDTASKTEARKGIGGGARFGGGFGFVLNDFLNFGIDVEYHKGSWVENSFSNWIDALDYDSTSSRVNYKTISLTPYVILKALAKPNYFIYNKLGILLTLPYTLSTSGKSSHSNNVNLQNNVNTFFENLYSAYSEKYKISLGVGLNAALGANVKVGNKFRVFGEIFGNYSALSPTSSQQINYNKRNDSLSFNYSNNNQLVVIKQISTVTTNTEYQKGGSLPLNGTYHSDPPETTRDGYTKTNVTINALSHKFTINSAVVGVNLGIIYRF